MIGEIETNNIPNLAPGPCLARLHTDKGTEDLGTAMKARLYERLIHHTSTMGYDPKANGLAERYVGLSEGQTRKLLFSSDLDEMALGCRTCSRTVKEQTPASYDAAASLWQQSSNKKVVHRRPSERVQTSSRHWKSISE